MGKKWLADKLYEYHDACETMQDRAGQATQKLTMVTDASVQHPTRGSMAEYKAEAEATAMQDSATSESELRWRWGKVEGGDAGWRLQTANAAGWWYETTWRGATVKPADVESIRGRGSRSVRQGRRAMGPADGGATEWAADAVRGGLPGSKDLRDNYGNSSNGYVGRQRGAWTPSASCRQECDGWQRSERAAHRANGNCSATRRARQS